jgi:hypothetical protein
LFKEHLLSFCERNVTIGKKIYSLTDVEGAEEEIIDVEYSTLDQYCHYFGRLCQLVPDGIMECTFHRTIVRSPPTFAFISYFAYTGSMLTSSYDLPACRLEEVGDFPDDISVSSRTSSPSAARWAEGRPQLFFTDGSMISYVNMSGRVERIEFYMRKNR